MLEAMSIQGRRRLDPSGNWLIEVPAAQLERAEQLLRQELVEQAEDGRRRQRAGPSEQLGARSGLYWVIGLLLVNCLTWWVLEARGGSEDHQSLLRFGAITTQLLHSGQWWRLITAQFLHIGMRHLLGNMALLLVLGIIALRAFGPGRMLFIYLIGGAVGNVAGFLFGSATALKAGASGAILALLGGLAGQRLRQSLFGGWQASRYKWWHVVGMVAAFYGIVVGTRPESDHYAHIGGLVGGALIVMLLPPAGRLSAARERWLQLALGGSAALLAGSAALLCWRA